MNQDIRDALKRLEHALTNEARQASLPTDTPALQLANDLLRGRLEEQERIVAAERARADAAEREAEYWRKEIRAIRDAAAKTMEDALNLMCPAVVLEQERNDLRAALDRLYGAVLHEMTARDLPHEWAPDSAMAAASALLFPATDHHEAALLRAAREDGR